jgi:hypothetical protein
MFWLFAAIRGDLRETEISSHCCVGPGYQNLRYLLAEGSAHGCAQDRNCGFAESRLKCGSHRVPAESRF